MDIRAALLKRQGKRSMSQFARDVRMSRQALINIRDGKSKPTYETLVRLGILRG